MRKTLQYILYVVFIIALLAVSVMLVRSWRNLRDMRGKVLRLQSELLRRKTECLELHQEIYELKNNPHAVEKVAREKFKLVGDDEVIYKYDPATLEEAGSGNGEK